jgi:hypothetical protein
MGHLHFFWRQAQPVPGTAAPAVNYPACEWRDPMAQLDAAQTAQHPLNRFVCSWLTSDMADVARCDEVLHALAQVQQQQLPVWFADGDAFGVDFTPSGVQFNQSNVGPEDTAWWNLPEARFALHTVQDALRQWRAFLATT